VECLCFVPDEVFLKSCTKNLEFCASPAPDLRIGMRPACAVLR
jgi:hypothetical protein